MIRQRIAFLLLVATASSLGPRSARAESPLEQAETLNNEGKALFKEERFYEASKRFRMAIGLNDDPRYYFNLCMSLKILEEDREALSQCREAKKRSQNSSLADKIQVVIDELEARTARPAPAPTPKTGNVATTTSAGVTQTFQPERQRRFSLGFEVGAMNNLSLGLGDRDLYNQFGEIARLNFGVDLSGAETIRPGVRLFLGYGFLGATELGRLEGDGLLFTEAGASGTLNMTISRRLVIGPYAGVSIANINASPTQDFTTMAIHAGANAEFRLGKMHALTLRLNLNYYTAADERTNERRPDAFGLDKSSRTLDLSFGYTIRL